MIARDDVAGLVLAGGMSQRFHGGAKECALLDGKRLVDHVVERARPQVRALAISRARGAPFVDLDPPTIEDIFEKRGPLGGVHAGLMWAASLTPRPTHLATFPCDAPNVPADLVMRLAAAAGVLEIGSAVARQGGHVHPTFALWSLECATRAAVLLKSGPLSLVNFAREVGAIEVDFPEEGGAAFANINTAEELAALQRIYSGESEPPSRRDR
jgi:molybdopterin-guanine dinucleotide biosynthesis protein A